MAIRKIYFQIHDKSRNRSNNSDFLFETYYITEYFSREISKHNYKYEAATRLFIYIDSSNSGLEYSSTFKTLDCYLPEDYQSLVLLMGAARTEKLLGYILLAATSADELLPGILDITKQIIIQFRNDNYTNRWIFHQKTIKGLGKAGLVCELDRNMFTLQFFLKNKDTVLFQKTILETKPDSLCYHYKFDKLIIEDDFITVPNRFITDGYRDIIFKISVNELEKIASNNA